MPLTEAGLSEAMDYKVKTGILEHAQMRFYRTAEALGPALRARQHGFLEYLDKSEARDRFQAWLDQNNKTAEDVMIGYFSGRYGAAWLVFDRKARYLGYFW
jgi:hypothetical protein